MPAETLAQLLALVVTRQPAGDVTYDVRYRRGNRDASIAASMLPSGEAGVRVDCSEFDRRGQLHFVLGSLVLDRAAADIVANHWIERKDAVKH